MSVVFGWRDEVPDGELARLHAEGFGKPVHADAWACGCIATASDG